MNRSGCLLALCLTAGCVVGAPPGFSSGDKWEVPLVAPLEADVLLVPVKINDAGPYLFQIDPDSKVSSIDKAIQTELSLYTVQAPEEVTETDRKVPVFLADVKKISVGTLNVRNRQVRVHKFGTYWVGGRRVRGVLGRDIIADSLVFGADRDQGLVFIATQGHLPPAAGATALKLRHYFGRELAKVSVAGKQATMHIDVGGPVSQVWPKKVKEWGLPPVGKRRRMTDEYGTVWEIKTGATAHQIVVAGQTASNIVVTPFADNRLEEEELDGTIGQDVLSRFNIVANWHKKRVWLSPRSPDLLASADQRTKRWGSVFENCKSRACVGVEVIGGPRPPAPTPQPAAPSEPPAPENGSDAPPPPPPSANGELAAPGASRPVPSGAPGAEPASVQLHVARESQVLDLSYEVLLEALGPDGKSLGLPHILVTLPAGAATIIEPSFDPVYAAASRFEVIDLSPFPRECQKADGRTRCVWQMRL